MFFYHDQLRLYYQRRGSGPVIVLLHGNGEDHTIFANLIEQLAPLYTVIAVDSRDHGQSSRTNRLSSMPPSMGPIPLLVQISPCQNRSPKTWA